MGDPHAVDVDLDRREGEQFAAARWRYDSTVIETRPASSDRMPTIREGRDRGGRWSLPC